MMHMAEDMLMATGCITPLYFYTDLYMIDSSVRGFFSNPLGYKYFMYSTVEGKDYINVCLASEPDTLDPALNSAVDGATMIAHLFAGLAKWTEVNGKLSIVADLAESLPEGVVNADGTITYTYTLKEGLKWSNGDALTAEDFERSWKRAASAALGADYGYMFEVVKGYGTDNPEDLAVEATDDRTLVVTLNNAVAYWNELLAFPTYMPVHSSAMNSENWATDPSTYICNGPYTMKSWDHKSKIVLEKNPDFYAADTVTMPTINCFLSDDDNAMLVNFKNNSWQLIDSVPTNEIKNLQADPQYKDEFKIAGQIGTYYVCWNVNKNILPADSELKGVEAEKAMQEIRNAVSLLLDRNYIVESVAMGGQLPASSFVAMGMTDADGTEFYKNANSKTDSFDGYYDVSREAYEANVRQALETLKKYYEVKEG
jgi:oligopeptide transport system substrate-binding protein